MKKITCVAVAALAVVACNKEGGVEKGLAITPETKTVYTDEELPVLELKATPTDLIDGLTVEWTSDAAEIVTVSDKGELAFAVKDIEDAEKTVTITAKAGEYSAKCTLTVKGQIAKYEIVDLTADFGFKMLDRNVGAKTTEEIGNFYQWGKNTPVASNDDTKVNESYDAEWGPESAGFADWTVAENTPCPKGWSLPDDENFKKFKEATVDIISEYEYEMMADEFGEWDGPFTYTEEEYNAAKAKIDKLGLIVTGKFASNSKKVGDEWVSSFTKNTTSTAFWYGTKKVDKDGNTVVGCYDNCFISSSISLTTAVPVRCVKSTATPVL